MTVIDTNLDCQLHLQHNTLRFKPTESGRFLLSATDAPLTDKERMEMKTIVEQDPEATARMSELASAAEMGLKLEYSKSPAFIGLLVADVKSAHMQGYSAPQVQMACEDDKVSAGAPAAWRKRLHRQGDEM